MLQVSEDTSHNKLFISTEHSSKEYWINGAIAILAFLPYLFPSEHGNFEILFKAIFTLGFLWLAAVNFADQESCEIDGKKKEIRITRKNRWKTKVFVHQLDKLSDVEVQNTKEQFRIRFNFEDGISLELTETLFSDKEEQEKVAQRIRTFLALDDDEDTDEEPTIHLVEATIKKRE